MSFEEEFPSLKELWQPKTKYSDNGGPLKVISGEFILKDLQKYCLDKQKVREVIDKLFSIVDQCDAQSIILNGRLKKELEL